MVHKNKKYMVIKQQEKYIEIRNKLKFEHKFLTPKLVGK